MFSSPSDKDPGGELVADTWEEDVARLGWICVNEVVPAVSPLCPVTASDVCQGHREAILCFQPNEQQNILQHRNALASPTFLLPSSSSSTRVDGSSVGEGSVMPCLPHNPFLESCCLVSPLDLALVNSGWILGRKNPEVSNSVFLLCCAPGPFLAGSIIFSLGCEVLKMLWRVVGSCSGECNMQSAGFGHLAAGG